MPASLPEDVIDALLDVRPGDRLDAIRANRPEARAHAQGTFTALFAPSDASHMSVEERWTVGAFVATLHGPGRTADFYSDALRAQPRGEELADAVVATATHLDASGPYGSYREPGLAAESVPGRELAVRGTPAGDVLGDRLAAALEHAHLLVLHPRDASPEHLQRLLDAGWDETGIVTLSQLVSFLTFQVRVVHGLRALASSSPAGGAA